MPSGVTELGELLQRSVMQALFGAGSGRGILAITAFNRRAKGMCSASGENTYAGEENRDE